MSGPTLVRVVDGPDAGMVHAVERRTQLGRGADVDLRLADAAVSRRHAILEPDPAGLLVVDTGSGSGTRVDGRRCSPSRVAGPGSVVRVGESTLIVLRPAPAPRVVDGRHRLEVSGPGTVPRTVDVDAEVMIGRDEACAVRVDHRSVSRRHATLRADGAELVLTDLGSANGTRVNGNRVRGERPVGPGDVVTVGQAGAQLVVAGRRRHTSPARELLVRAEGSDAARPVSVAARPGATVQHVVDELAAHLDLPAGAGTVWAGYLASSGRLLLGEDRWDHLPLPRGEVLTVAAFDRVPARAESSTRGAEWPEPPDPTVNTPPRATAPPAPVAVTLPRVPEGTALRGRGVLWQVAGGGIAVLAAAVVALQFRSAALFAVVGAVAGLATMAFGLVGDQSRRRHGVREFREGLARVESTLSGAATTQAATLRDLAPDLATLRGFVHGRSSRLWERRVDDADTLRLALGVGSRSLARTLSDQGTEHGPYAAELRALLDRWQTVPDVPVTTPGGGIVGVAGPRRLTTEVAAHAVVEAAVLHAPSTLAVVVVGGGPDWRWVGWLPHVTRRTSAAVAAATTPAEVTAALAQGGTEGRRRVLVVLAPGADAQLDTSLLLRAVDPATGLVLVLEDDLRALPPECEVVVAVAPDGTATAEGAWPDGPAGAFRVRRVAPDAAEELAIALGRLSDPRAQDRRVDEVGGVLALSGAEGPSGPDVSGPWAAGPGALDAVFAVDDSGSPVSLDLRRDGPHGVIAGTTGAGKSELLLSVLGSLVARHPPEHLVLFLIDFKGGATFAPLRELPHVVGYVTDLDGAERLSERAFTALEAEILRRKRVLAAAGVPDLAAHERRGGSERLPSLLVVIDEFALLVTEQPSVKARLDAVAAQGRSLGIHLLLATQSPGGVVTPAIRANTNVWLCLRVANEGESLELLGSRQAAHIPSDRPGRAYLRRGAENALTAFQTARITVPGEGADDTGVEVSTFGDDGAPRSRVAAAEEGAPTQLDLLVAAAVAEHHRRGGAAPRALWVPPLPAQLDPGALPSVAELAVGATRGGDEGGGRGRRLDVVVGLLDEPHEQRQRPWVVDVAASNMLVAGVFRSGRTTTVRQVVHGLVAERSAAELHLYLVDARGDLADLAALPHVGGHVGVHDRELLVALVDRLGALIDFRREQGYDAARDPHAVLVVDDYASFREASQGLLHDRLTDRFATIAASGPSLGVHVVVTCSQVGELRMTLAAHFLTRILLRQPDPSDYVAIDVRLTTAELPPDLPGRGMVKGGTEVQVAWARGLPGVTGSDGRDGGPRPLLRLPTDHVEPREHGRTGWPEGHVPVGVGGDDRSTVWLGPRHGPHLLVLGESLSGRTTALRTVVERLLAEDPDRRLAVVAQRRTAAWAWDDHPRLLAAATSSTDVEALLDAVEAAGRAGRPVVLALDDAEGLALPGTVGDRLDRLLRTARDHRLRSVVTGRAADWPRLFDGWARYLTSLRTLLLLAPTPESAVALDIRLPPSVVPMVPGRGFLVSGGRTEVLQVTRLDEARDPAAGPAHGPPVAAS